MALQRPWNHGRDSVKLLKLKNRMAIRLARNPLLAALLLVTFVARALIPAGFMPGPDSSLDPTVVQKTFTY